MNTLSSTDKNKLPLSMDNALGMQFPCEDIDDNMTIGKLVTLKDDGLVYPSVDASADELPIGYVTVPNKLDKSVCTIDTFGIAKAGSIANGGIDIGMKLSVDSNGKVKACASGEYAIGIALTSAVDEGEVSVMYFYSPVYIA